MQWAAYVRHKMATSLLHNEAHGSLLAKCSLTVTPHPFAATHSLPTSLSVLAVLRAFATPTNSTPGKLDTQALLADGVVAFERCSCYAASTGRNPAAFKNLTDSGV